MRSWLAKPLPRFLTLLLLLLLLRLPFYFTHHVQEDAYISLRCAENLAETGVYGFNPGERVSSSTSHLYVFLSAQVRLVVGRNAFIPAMLVVNTLMFLCGTYFLARVMLSEEKEYLLLWVLISVLPISLLISYSGMETSLLIFIIGLTLYLLQSKKPHWAAWLGLALLPWVRPDAVAFALLILFWYCIRQRRVSWGGLGAVAAGAASLLFFNQVYFGALLQQSITAKMLMRHTFTFAGFMENARTVFIGQSGGIFSPIRTKYFDSLGIVFLVIILSMIFLYLWRKGIDRAGLLNGLTLASMALVVPLAYAFGGVLYQWYFWPSAMFGYVFLLALLVGWLTNADHAPRLSRWVIGLVLIASVIAQWVFSYAWGMKEYAYRGGIGVWLSENAEPGERLLLEPAGYIPYYSGLYTYDEVGLVSPQVVTYRQEYELRWWSEFVQDFQPEWVVQRGQIAEYMTYQGYEMNEAEREWFQQHYQLVARFHFRPEDYVDRSFFARLLSLGEVDDYYVFHFVR